MGLRSFLPVLFKRWCKFPTGAAAGYKNHLVFQELQADQGDPQQSAEWWNSFPEPSWNAAHHTGRLSDQQQEHFCLRRMLCRAQLKEANIVHDRSFCYVARLFWLKILHHIICRESSLKLIHDNLNRTGKSIETSNPNTRHRHAEKCRACQFIWKSGQPDT